MNCHMLGGFNNYQSQITFICIPISTHKLGYFGAKYKCYFSLKYFSAYL